MSFYSVYFCLRCPLPFSFIHLSLLHMNSYQYCKTHSIVTVSIAPSVIYPVPENHSSSIVPPFFAYCSTIHFCIHISLPPSIDCKLPGVSLCIPSIQHPAIQAIFCHINDYVVHTENFISISQTLDKIPYFLSNHQKNAGVNLVCTFSLHLDSMFEPRFLSIDRHR